MKDSGILNVKYLKVLCRCVERDPPKPFKNTMQKSLNCLNWNRNEDALKTEYGLMLKTFSTNFY